MWGEQRVRGFLLTSPVRLDLGLSLARRFERARIRIPYDPVIRSDLQAIRRKATADDGLRLVNDSVGEGEGQKGRGKKVHADRFWAAAIASRLADFPAPEFDYRAVNRAGGSPRPRDFMRPDHSTDFQSRSWRGRRGF